jgi:peptidoglycan/xylan/chitin deacetylase (PgdA/CDA1 family)
MSIIRGVAMAMKRLALRLMRNGGAFALARATSAGMARILMYHNFCGPDETDSDAVDVPLLRDQFAYLRRHFRVVPLARVIEQLRSGGKVDAVTVALTIDDGRRNCYEFLFPLLKEFAMPATFFVVSSFIAREDWLWTDKVLWLSGQPTRSDELSSLNIEKLFGSLNRMRPEARDARIAAIAATMAVSIPKEAPPKYAPCSWSELRDMADSGLVEIGSHTVTHPILASITDEESRWELTVSRSQIEAGLGCRISSFCFPNGQPSDYRPSQVRQIIDAGYTSAVVARPGMVSHETSAYELPRLGVSGHGDVLSFAKDVDGVEYYQAKLQSALNLRKAHENDL